MVLTKQLLAEPDGPLIETTVVRISKLLSVIIGVEINIEFIPAHKFIGIWYIAITNNGDFVRSVS
ncbi:hypothetical protein A8L34_13755 [Bacillus sp. FJAT-27264]|nr:hypothetical protein A8L34_13755 [Bacillus sp. FJAT-27264]